MKQAANWEGTSIPSTFMLEARTAIKEELSAHLTMDELYDRYQVLEQRYRTFKEVLKVPGTHWDVDSNAMTALEVAWENIFEKTKFAEAYYRLGEPEFNKMSVLFGGNVIKLEPSTTVIIISDSTDHVDGVEGDKSNASEEVSSPIVGEPLKLRRKLFKVEETPEDMESTNVKGNYLYVEGSDGRMKCTLVNMCPPQPREHKKEAKEVGNSRASSCASSPSPNKCCTNILK